MKKPYSKPVLCAEAFELMEHVAGDCIVNDDFAGAKHRNSTDCRYTDGNLALFYSGGVNCDSDLMYGFSNDEIAQMIAGNTLAATLKIKCYNSFLQTSNLFAS